MTSKSGGVIFQETDMLTNLLTVVCYMYLMCFCLLREGQDSQLSITKGPFIGPCSIQTKALSNQQNPGNRTFFCMCCNIAHLSSEYTLNLVFSCTMSIRCYFTCSLCRTVNLHCFYLIFLRSYSLSFDNFKSEEDLFKRWTKFNDFLNFSPSSTTICGGGGEGGTECMKIMHSQGDGFVSIIL